MRIIDYFESENRAHWLDEIAKSDWSAGELLHGWLTDGVFREKTGEGSTVLLLTDGEKLVSFCTYAERDDIPDTELTPWMGFVYTFPAYRGHRYAGVLMEDVLRRARDDGHAWIHISTDHVGLYEKYGCAHYTTLTEVNGYPARVYRKATGL